MADITKRAAPREAAPNKNIYQQKYKPISLADKARPAIKSLPKGQCKRLVLFLLTNPASLTSTIARICSIGNVSHVACCVNPVLRRYGIEIAHEFARQDNQFGEPSMMHRWWLQEVSE